MALLGLTEETDNLFPCVKLLDLIRDDKWGWGGGGGGVEEASGFENKEVVFEQNTIRNVNYAMFSKHKIDFDEGHEIEYEE